MSPFYQRIHRYLIWQHRWTGLLMAAFLTVVGVTGSLLVYTPEIERIINPQFFAKPPQADAKQLEMGQIADRVEAAEPSIRVGYFFRNISDSVYIRILPRTNPATGKPYDVNFDHVYVDPWTGKVLAHRKLGNFSQLRANLMPFIRSLHTDLLTGNTGAIFLGYVALVWTIDCFIGFYLTLPLTRGRFWRRWGTAWWVKWRASGYRINFDLHRAGGLWLWPILFIFAWSSVYFELPSVYEKVMKTTTSFETGEEFLARAGGHAVENPALTWQEAEGKGRQYLQQQAARRGWHLLRPALLAYIVEFGVYSYSIQTDQDFRANNPDSGVWIDGNTGELRRVFPPRSLKTGNFLTNLIIGLHFADLKCSQAYRLFVFLLGFVISMLSITGIVIWWRKRRVRILAELRTQSTGRQTAALTTDL